MAERNLPVDKCAVMTLARIPGTAGILANTTNDSQFVDCLKRAGLAKKSSASPGWDKYCSPLNPGKDEIGKWGRGCMAYAARRHTYAASPPWPVQNDFTDHLLSKIARPLSRSAKNWAEGYGESSCDAFHSTTNKSIQSGHSKSTTGSKFFPILGCSSRFLRTQHQHDS
jgi:hypothetical protein